MSIPARAHTPTPETGRVAPHSAPRDMSGPAPLPTSTPCPSFGQHVVYLLLDAQGTVCYVGRTEQFRTRLKRHMWDGKPAVRWMTRRCADKAEAVALECAMIGKHKPYLNGMVQKWASVGDAR